MKETKYWTWHIAAGLVLLFLLGLHMLIMHAGGVAGWFAPHGDGADSPQNSLFRDSKLFFTTTYVLMLAAALYHGFYGLRTMLLELTLRPAIEKTITVILVVAGLGLCGLGTWAALKAHAIALAGARG